MGDFPSGQRGQTVNLLSLTSVVRIHHPPPTQKDTYGCPFVLVGDGRPFGTHENCKKRNRGQRQGIALAILCTKRTRKAWARSCGHESTRKEIFTELGGTPTGVLFCWWGMVVPSGRMRIAKNGIVDCGIVKKSAVKKLTKYFMG